MRFIYVKCPWTLGHVHLAATAMTSLEQNHYHLSNPSSVVISTSGSGGDASEAVHQHSLCTTTPGGGGGSEASS